MLLALWNGKWVEELKVGDALQAHRVSIAAKFAVKVADVLARLQDEESILVSLFRAKPSLEKIDFSSKKQSGTRQNSLSMVMLLKQKPRKPLPL